ncbi:MAG: hypothetical protein WBE26_01900 [Phycisphaerae bacterium]
MTQAVVTIPDPTPQAASGHEGSASLTLSGRAILAAWVISIAVHALLFFGMLTLVFPFTGGDEEPDPPVVHVEIIGPVEAASFVPSRSPDLSSPPTVPDPHEIRIPPKEFTPLSELTSPKKPDLTIIGIGTGGGDFSRYGLAVSPGPGPEFFGLGGSARGARRIIYVVDRSGSMIDTFIYVQEELKRSISALRRSQKFHVIFFNAGPPLENPPKRLVSAIDAHKERFFEFLDDTIARGGTKPEGAMRRALAMEPDLVYLLSDGIDFHPSLLHKLDEWNRDRRVRIYTIAYLDPTGSKLLEQIAREHNGEFRFVSEDDLP